MKEVEVRYSQITEKFPREFILLQGTGCFWKKCIFCDYFHDISQNPFEINSPVIEKITGKFATLDVINSGSAMELDNKTLDALIKKIDEKNINEIWFEVHWAYRHKLKDFSEEFKGRNVNFRAGVETFNGTLRESWNKGIPKDVTPQQIAKYFKSVCLLVGLPGQDLGSVIDDIRIAKKYFKRFVISVFVKNSTKMVPNDSLIKEFMSDIYPKIKNDPQIEILINNTDLRVG